MALIGRVTFPTGLTADDVYIRIERFTGDKENVHIVISYYLNKSSGLQGKAPLLEENYYFPLDLQISNNILRQGYMYLKSLSKFKDIVDDLEN